MLKLRCPKHPRYSGKGDPPTGCGDKCQEIRRIRIDALCGITRLEVVEAKPKEKENQ